MFEEELLLDDHVRRSREIFVCNAQGVGASCEAVLDHDAVATDDVSTVHLLGDNGLTCHVHDFNNHVVRSEVELLIELNAEVAFEHGVREHVPLAVLQAEELCHWAVVRCELAIAIVVSSVAGVVAGIRVGATKHFCVRRCESDVVVAPGLPVRGPALHVQRASGDTVCGDLHQEDEVAGISHGAHIRRNDKPSSIDNFECTAFIEGSEIDANVPQVVIAAVFSTNGYPAVKSEGLVDSDYSFVNVNSRSTTKLILVDVTSTRHVEEVFPIGEYGVKAVLARGQLSVNTVGVAVNGSTIVNSLYYKLNIAGGGGKAEYDSCG